MKSNNTIRKNARNAMGCIVCEGIQVKLAGIDIHLYAKRAAYSPEMSTLFLADTHLGKEATFRNNGIPVPNG